MARQYVCTTMAAQRGMAQWRTHAHTYPKSEQAKRHFRYYSNHNFFFFWFVPKYKPNKNNNKINGANEFMYLTKCLQHNEKKKKPKKKINLYNLGLWKFDLEKILCCSCTTTILVYPTCCNCARTYTLASYTY